MKPILDYELISETSLFTFNRKVANNVKDGWRLHGKTSVIVLDKSTENLLYSQAMVKPI
jgi:hypothetical protein